MYNLLFSLACGSLILYFIFIFLSLKGWLTSNEFHHVDSSNLPCCSVLVAVRNESQNIHNLLSDVLGQAYFPTNWELILIDDHSEDSSHLLMADYANQHASVRNIHLAEGRYGKKEAIAAGLSIARHGIILQTDADCRLPRDWMASMLAPFSEGADMSIGPVCYLYDKGIFNALMRLEFSSMVLAGAGLAKAGRPVFCNAANMAYRVCEESLMNGGEKSASGDDVFLLHQFKRLKRKIVFVHNTDAIVHTNAPVDLSAFFQQRIRWGSKAKYYTDFDSIALSLLIASINICLACSVIALLWQSYILFAIVYIGKTVADFIFLAYTLPFYRQTRLLLFVPLLSIFYPFYIAAVSIYSIFAKYEWKGRRLN